MKFQLLYKYNALPKVYTHACLLLTHRQYLATKFKYAYRQGIFQEKS